MKIIFKPIIEFVVSEVILVKDIKELARPLGLMAAASEGTTIGLQWAEGVIFMFCPVHLTTDVGQEEYLENGRIYVPSISYALLDNYVKSIKTDEGLIVPVFDASEAESMRELAKWLKEWKGVVKGIEG